MRYSLPMASLDDFARALGAFEASVDWERLGALHCHDGGEAFFPPEQIEAIREAGLQIAGELGQQLGGLRGRSLYAGAAIAEVVPVLVERFVLQREVVWLNLPGAESELMNAAFEAAESQCGLELPRIETGSVEGVTGTFDHGWLVSVLNDPEAFPALHDALYGRSGELATGRGNLLEDKARAEALAESVFDRLEPGALLSTTDEELPVLRPLIARRGWGMRVSPDALLTGVVGDPLRFVRLVSSPA